MSVVVVPFIALFMVPFTVLFMVTLDANPYDRRSGEFGRDVGISDVGAETSILQKT